MFNLSYTSPCEVQGIIILTEKPWRGLGIYTDIDGNRWDVRGVIGDYVQACPEHGLHPYFTDTSGTQYGLVRQRWLPYKWILADKETGDKE